MQLSANNPPLKMLDHFAGVGRRMPAERRLK